MDKKKTGYGVGMLIADSILILELVIDIVKGEVTSVDFIKDLVLVLLLTIPFVLWMRSRKNKAIK